MGACLFHRSDSFSLAHATHTWKPPMANMRRFNTHEATHKPGWKPHSVRDGAFSRPTTLRGSPAAVCLFAPSQSPYVQVFERRVVRVSGCCYHGANKSGGGVPQGDNENTKKNPTYKFVFYALSLRRELLTSYEPPPLKLAKSHWIRLTAVVSQRREVR